MSASVTVKCVICGHKEKVPLTREMPACSKCFGPVTAEAVERKVVRRGK